MRYPDYSLIIPTLNEERNIRLLLSEILRRYPGMKVLVSDDGSTDATQQIVRAVSSRNPAIQLIDRQGRKEKGLTASVIEGLLLAQTPYAIVMDGDLQHPPSAAGKIASALATAGIVIGTRKNVLSHWPLHRRVISRGAILLAQLRLMRPIRDPVSGLFGIRTGLFRKVYAGHKKRFKPTGYKVLFDILKYLPPGTRTTEVPYDFGTRGHGTSKMRLRHMLLFFRSLFD